MEKHAMRHHAILRWTARVAALLLLAAGCMAAGVLYGWTHVARALPPLQGWHLQAPPSEFMAADARPDYDFEAYRRQEARVFGELDELVNGPWALEVQTEAGTGTPQVTFKQDGEKLTGVYSSQLLGELELTGGVKGQAIQFTLAANVQGNAIDLVFSGTVDDSASMKGKVTFTGFGEGTFTAKRM